MSEIIQENGKYYLQTEHGRSRGYDSIDDFVSDGYRIVSDRERKGYISDVTGSELKLASWEALKPYKDGYIIVKVPRKGWSIGCCNSNKKIDYSQIYYEDVLVHPERPFMSLKLDGKWRLQKYNNVQPHLIERQWGDIKHEYHFPDVIFAEDVIFCLYNKDCWRMFNADGIRIERNRSFSLVKYIPQFSLIIVQDFQSRLYGVFNKDGSINIGFAYKEISFNEESLTFEFINDKDIKSNKKGTDMQKTDTDNHKDEKYPLQLFFSDRLINLYEYAKHLGGYNGSEIINALCVLDENNIEQARNRQKKALFLENEIASIKKNIENIVHKIDIHPLDKIAEPLKPIIEKLKRKQDKTDDEIFNWLKEMCPEECSLAEKNATQYIAEETEKEKEKIRDVIREKENEIDKLVLYKNFLKQTAIIEEDENNYIKGLEINKSYNRDYIHSIIGGYKNKHISLGTSYIGVFLEEGKKYGIIQGWSEKENCYHLVGVGDKNSGNQFTTVGDNRSIIEAAQNGRKVLLFVYDNNRENYLFKSFLKYVSANETVEPGGTRKIVVFRFQKEE